MHAQVASRGSPGRRLANELNCSVPGFCPLIVTLQASGIGAFSVCPLVLAGPWSSSRAFLTLGFLLSSSLSAPQAGLYQPHCPVHGPSD